MHCVVTSPPYWDLRDYGVTGQIGLEPSIERGRRAPDVSDSAETTGLHGTQAQVGWESGCECAAVDPVSCTVLDPFAGAGTVGLVANRLGRDAILDRTQSRLRAHGAKTY